MPLDAANEGNARWQMAYSTREAFALKDLSGDSVHKLVATMNPHTQVSLTKEKEDGQVKRKQKERTKERKERRQKRGKLKEKRRRGEGEGRGGRRDQREERESLPPHT